MRYLSVRSSTLLLLCATFASVNAVQADTLQISADQRLSTALTLYNQNLGLVRESRQLPRLQANQRVVVEDVSQELQVESLRISNAGTILEQNLNTNLLNQHSLLQHYVGKILELARLNPATGQEIVTSVQLLNIDGNRALIKRNNHFETIPLNDQWRFLFPSLPPQLLSKPSLSFTTSGTEYEQPAQISYLSGGLNWNMDYVLSMGSNSDKVSLEGYASLSNQTGTDFQQAYINLLAGNVYQPANRYQARQRGIELMSAMSADAASPEREQLQDFHLYTLPRKTDLLNGQVKQVSLLSAKQVHAEREYSYNFLVYPTLERNQHRVNPEVKVKFKNSTANNLGMPLPAGNLRAFSPDSRGELQFIGGAHIDHTSEGNSVAVKLGKAFDLSIHRKQTTFSKTFDGYLVGQELRISNSRNKPATITMLANFPLEWEIQRSSHPYERVQGGSAQWQIDVPAKGDAVLHFKTAMKKR